MTTKGRPVFRHEAIARQLVADIRAGVYPVGSQLPTELNLCTIFGASRHTVRQALATLTERGLIVRRTSSGSMIISAHEPRILVQSTEPMASQLSGPSDLQRAIVATEYVTVDANLANLLDCEAGEEWFSLKTINRSRETGEVVSAAKIFVPKAYAGIVDHPDHERMRISDQILSMYDEIIERVQVEVVAGPLPSEAQAVLGEGSGIGLTVIRRYTGRTGQLFEVSMTFHSEGQHVFLVELRRPKAASLS